LEEQEKRIAEKRRQLEEKWKLEEQERMREEEKRKKEELEMLEEERKKEQEKERILKQEERLNRLRLDLEKKKKALEAQRSEILESQHIIKEKTDVSDENEEKDSPDSEISEDKQKSEKLKREQRKTKSGKPRSPKQKKKKKKRKNRKTISGLSKNSRFLLEKNTSIPTKRKLSHSGERASVTTLFGSMEVGDNKKEEKIKEEKKTQKDTEEISKKENSIENKEPTEEIRKHTRFSYMKNWEQQITLSKSGETSLIYTKNKNVNKERQSTEGNFRGRGTGVRGRGSAIGRGSVIRGRGSAIGRGSGIRGRGSGIRGSGIRGARGRITASGGTRKQSISNSACSQDIQALKLQKARAMVRHKVAKEIFSTEVSYVEGLEAVEKKFLVPLRTTHKRLLTEKQIEYIFWNLSDILKYHHKFLGSLKTRVENWNNHSCLGDIFLEETDFLKNYQPYLQGYNASLITLRHLRKRKPDLEALNKEFENQQRETTSLDLESYMLTPVQRIPRYILLLKEFNRYTNPTHAENLNKAITKLTSILNEINSNVDADVLFRAEKLHSIEDSIDGIDDLYKPDRIYVREGAVTLQTTSGKKNLYMFFFSDIMIGCVKKKEGKKTEAQYDHHVTIKLDQISKAFNANTRRGEINICVGQEVWILQIKAKLDKDLWLTDILKYSTQGRKSRSGTRLFAVTK